MRTTVGGRERGRRRPRSVARHPSRQLSGIGVRCTPSTVLNHVAKPGRFTGSHPGEGVPSWFDRRSSSRCRVHAKGPSEGAWTQTGEPIEVRGCDLFQFVDGFSFSGGSEEVCEAGEAYHAPPGHTPTLYAGTEVVEFSPTGRESGEGRFEPPSDRKARNGFRDARFRERIRCPAPFLTTCGGSAGERGGGNSPRPPPRHRWPPAS
jgi:hypothetical protein